MNRCFLFAFSLLVFLTGCSNQRIIDQIQIIQSISYDRVEDKIKGTVIYGTFEEKGKTKLLILETESDAYDDILPRLNAKSAFPIEKGQLRLILFGKEFAKQGVDTVIHGFSLDPDVGSRLQLGITEHQAGNMLASSKNVNLPFHLADKINQNIQKGNLPKMNLHLFLANFYGEGRDPYLPYFIHEKGEVKINGLALFKKGKYINNIDLRQSFILKMLVDGSKDGQYKIKIKENKKEGFILLRNLDAKAKYTINQIDPIPLISIDLTINAQLRHVPLEVDLTENNNILKLEKQMDEHFNKEVQKLISVFQEYEVDPLGLGDRVRAKSRNWDYGRFRELYPQLKTTVNTKVKIIQTGVGE